MLDRILPSPACFCSCCVGKLQKIVAEYRTLAHTPTHTHRLSYAFLSQTSAFHMHTSLCVYFKDTYMHTHTRRHTHNKQSHSGTTNTHSPHTNTHNTTIHWAVMFTHATGHKTPLTAARRRGVTDEKPVLFAAPSDTHHKVAYDDT